MNSFHHLWVRQQSHCLWDALSRYLQEILWWASEHLFPREKLVLAFGKLEFSGLHNTYPLVDQDTALELSMESDPRTCRNASCENLKLQVGNLRVVELCRTLVLETSILANNLPACVPRSILYLRFLSLLQICLHWRNISFFHLLWYLYRLMQRFFCCLVECLTLALFRLVCLAAGKYWNYWLKFSLRVIMYYRRIPSRRSIY